MADDWREDDANVGPRTIEEALEFHLCTDFDFDMLHNSDMNWVIEYLEADIVELCRLDENEALREACGHKDMEPIEAARVIAKEIWKYWNP